MAVQRVTKITASSPKGWQEALKAGLDRANKTLRNLEEIRVIDQKVTIKNGKIDEYWLTLEIVFTLENPDSKTTTRRRKK